MHQFWPTRKGGRPTPDCLIERCAIARAACVEHALVVQCGAGVKCTAAKAMHPLACRVPGPPPTTPSSPQVKVHKGHPAGVISVRFRDAEGAAAALERMDGRFFGGRRISAVMWDGVTNYNVKVHGGLTKRAHAGRAMHRQRGHNCTPQALHLFTLTTAHAGDMPLACVCLREAYCLGPHTIPCWLQVKETPEEEAARLEAYTRELEAREAAAAAAEAAAGGGDTAAAAEAAVAGGDTDMPYIEPDPS